MAALPITYTSKELREYFEYREDGKLFWKNNPKRSYMNGRRAGSKMSSGHLIVSLGGTSYLVHRLIWVMFNGEIDPELTIDHLNRVRDDNRIENLRLVSHAENMQNQKGAGVARQSSGRWYAHMRENRVRVHLGTFDTKEEAHAAYLEAKGDKIKVS